MMEEIIRVKVENLVKYFNRDFKRNESALFRILSFVSGRGSRRRFRVLDRVSFRVSAGKNLGVIGVNGSGK